MVNCKKDGNVWWVTLMRPEKANALTKGMLESMRGILERAAKDPEIRALILTGSGNTFCAGADLDEAKAGLAASPIWEEISGMLHSLPCMTFASIIGPAAGGGMCLALACDIRVALPHAEFFYPVMQHGFLPQPSDVKRLDRLIGPSRTRLMLMAGKKFPAHEALQIGLVDSVQPTLEDLGREMARLAFPATRGSAEILRGIKSMCAGSGSASA